MTRARGSAISSATFNLKEQEDHNNVWNNVTGAVNATGEASFGQLTTFSKLTASALVEVLSRSHKGAFARARAAGKNETEAGHARAKAGADIALSLPAEYSD